MKPFILTSALLCATLTLSAQVNDGQGQVPPSGQQPPTQDQGYDPSRGVARLSLLNGAVSVQRGDSGDVLAAVANAPLLTDDRVTTGADGRAEIQFDYANRMRICYNGDVRISDLQEKRYQVQIAHGTIAFSVIRDSQPQVELSTPSVSVRPIKRGLYRITVGDDGLTTVTVRSGEAEIFSPRGAEQLYPGKTMLVRGTASDPEFQLVTAIGQDSWDQWNYERDRMLDHSQAYRYVSPDVTGAEDLDSSGRWVDSPEYGNVWTPSVGPDWAPYRDGRWVWEDFYGWTWVGNEPWGWAPYHYGRWFNSAAYGWCWYPGGLRVRQYWSPALVGFFGFGGFGGVGIGVGFGGFGFGGLGWCPLAPFEVLHPWWGRGFYGGGRLGYNNITNVNISNIYRNARVANGISGLNSRDFASGRFVNPRSVPLAQVRQAGLVKGALPLVPQRGSLQLANRTPQVRSATNFAQRGFFSRTAAAPVNRVPFTQQQRSIEQSSRGTTAAPARSVGPAWRPASPNSEAAPRASSAAPRQAAESSHGWSHFGSPSYAGGASQPSTRSYSPGNSAYGHQSLQIAPPIVRERSTPSYGYSGHSAPSYSQPRYSAPSHSSGSAPHYSAPSHSSGGGGGSSHPSSSGGGHGSSHR